MKNVESQLLRVYIAEQNKYEGKPLYEVIVTKARELKLAGATVLRGVLGFGAHSHLHSAKLLDLSANLSLVVEVVDAEENIQKLVPFIKTAAPEALVTVEKVKVL